MSYCLYYAPGTASFCVHWALIHIGADFAAVKIDLKAGDQREPAYLRLNPSGRVPTLIVDGAPHGESAALLMLLAERHSDAGLAPAPGSPERADWLQQMLFLANTILPAMRDIFYAETDGHPADADAVKRLALKRIHTAWERLDARLADGRAAMIGQAPGVLDFLAVMLMRWSRNLARPATDWPNLAAYVQRMRALPSYNLVCDREGLSDWRNTAP